ncbi:unnamed protein product [Trichobilharzia regenti]|nr:unnamed protein product [Trichobilharzia regenti]
MPSKLSKWLSAYKPSSRESMDELIEWMYSSAKLVDDIEETFEKLVSTSVISDVCQRLFAFYKSGLPPLQNFVILLLPSLLHTYLCHSYEDNTSVFQVKKSVSSQTESSQSSLLTSLSLLESCLLSICNCYLAKSGPIKGEFECFGSDINNFRLPSLTTPSVFHNPVRLASLSKRPRIPTSSSLLMILLNCCDLILFKLDNLDKCSPNSSSGNRPIEFIRSSVLDSILEINNRAAHHCFPSCLLVCQSLLHYRGIYYGYRDRKPKLTDALTRDIENIPGSRSGLGITAGGAGQGAAAAAPPPLPLITINSVEDKTSHPEYAIRPKLSISTTATEVFTSASFKPEAVSEDIPPVVYENPKSNSNNNKFNQSVKQGKLSGMLIDTNIMPNTGNKDNANESHSKKTHINNNNRSKIGADFRTKSSEQRKHHIPEKVVVYTPNTEQ